MKEYIEVMIEKIEINNADIIRCSNGDIDFPEYPEPFENAWQPPGTR